MTVAQLIRQLQLIDGAANATVYVATGEGTAAPLNGLFDSVEPTCGIGLDAPDRIITLSTEQFPGEFSAPERCDRCGGSGDIGEPGQPQQQCPICRGSGTIDPEMSR